MQLTTTISHQLDEIWVCLRMGYTWLYYKWQFNGQNDLNHQIWELGDTPCSNKPISSNHHEDKYSNPARERYCRKFSKSTHCARRDSPPLLISAITSKASKVSAASRPTDSNSSRYFFRVFAWTESVMPRYWPKTPGINYSATTFRKCTCEGWNNIQS